MFDEQVRAAAWAAAQVLAQDANERNTDTDKKEWDAFVQERDIANAQGRAARPCYPFHKVCIVKDDGNGNPLLDWGTDNVWTPPPPPPPVNRPHLVPGMRVTMVDSSGRHWFGLVKGSEPMGMGTEWSLTPPPFDPTSNNNAVDISHGVTP